MEEQISSMPDLQVDESVRSSLKETAWWTYFFSAVLMFFIALLTLGFLCILFFGKYFAEAFKKIDNLPYGSIDFLPGILGVTIFIVLVFLVVITWYLYRFSSQTTKAINRQNQLALEDGMNALKTYLVIGGVLSIITLLPKIFQLFKLLL